MTGKVKAIISGQSGVALLIKDGELASLHAGRGAEVVPRRPSEARLLLGDATDLQVLENADIREVNRRLEIATTQRDALHIALILLDGSLTGNTRREAAGELQELLGEEAVTVFVEGVLFSSPLPADADLVGARELATNAPRAMELLERLGSLQESVREVREAWERIPVRIFGSDEKRAQMQTVAVREGGFRAFVLEHHESLWRPYRALRLPAAFTSLPGSRAISREWRRSLEARRRDKGEEESGFFPKLRRFFEAPSGKLAAAASGALVLLIFLGVGWIARIQAIEKETRASAATLASSGQESLLAGNFSSAIESFDKALTLYQELDGSQRERAVILASQAKAYQELQRSDQALMAFQEAASLSRMSGDRQLQAQSLAGIGSILCRRDNHEGFTALREALEMARGLDAESEVATHLGFCVGRQGMDPELDNSPTVRVAALLGNSAASWRQGRVEEALARAQQAAVAENALTVEERRGVRRSATEWGQGTSSDLMVQLLMEKHRRSPTAGHDSEAFEVYERAIARAAMDSMIAASEMLDEDFSFPEGPRVRVSVSLPLPTTSLQEIQEKVLDDKTVLLEYYLGEPRSFLWLVTRESVESFELAGRSYLEDVVRSAYSAVVGASPETSVRAWRRMTAVSRALLGPAADRLLSSGLSLSVLIVAPGPLAYFPFAALPLPGVSADLSLSKKWGPCLIERHKIFTAPSASMLLAVRKNAAQKKAAQRELVILADPVVSRDDRRLEQAALSKADSLPGSEEFNRIPHSRQEAEEILALFPRSESLLAAGFEADRRAVLSGMLQGFRLVHFAAHSSPNPEEPWLSSLVLSLFDRQGRPVQGKLRAAEVAGLDLSAAELVVLSTQALYRDRGELPRWEEASLPASFLEAGAARVLFSTWCVSDRAAADLMAAFYQELVVHQLSVPEALQRTQLRLLRDPRYGSPYYWAGFTLQGDWS